jgi:tripeptide aminopeptidase
MDLESMVSHPVVRAARAAVLRRDRATLDEQIRIAGIPAPTGGERDRAAYIRERFVRLGLEGVTMDEVGNVIGRRPGWGPAEKGAKVLVTAHLDTVFPPGTEVVPRTEGQRVFGPGITDNARGLAAMLAIVEALRESEVGTNRPLVFIATVGEEGVGDLRGVKHLFRDGSPYRDAAAFFSIDGAGSTRIVHEAIGSYRLRATIAGLGGHSWGDRGLANPVHALGRAIGELSALAEGEQVHCAVNVGRAGGGTSVNSIPAEAWLELDLRSDDAAMLERLEGEARAALERGVRTETDSCARGGPLVLTVDRIGNRPCGGIPRDSEIVEAAVAATRLVGRVPDLAASSTDANVPISLGIPAIAMGAGGRAGGIHTTEEWFENHGGAQGVERVLLAILGIAGVGDLDQGS